MPRSIDWSAASCLFTILLGATASAQDVASPAAEIEEPLSLHDAVVSGEHWISLRLRSEMVDQDGFDKDALALTLRTVLGYETARSMGWAALVEMEDISTIGGETFNSTVNGTTDRPVIADPDTTEINQAYLSYTGIEDTTFRFGRQRIQLDNWRFVANAPWRQNEQTFDAASLQNTSVDGLTLFAAHVTNANRVLGDDNPAGNLRTSAVLLNAGYELEDWGKLVGYSYDLDNRGDFAGVATRTVGGSFVGSAPLGGDAGEELSATFHAEFARQSDTGDNPFEVDADYSRLEGGIAWDGTHVRLGLETLGGSGAPGDKFTTPFAALHGVNGLADQFLVTPDDGLEDLYLRVTHHVGDTRVVAAYHQFSSDTGSREYGQEFDLTAVHPLAKNASVGFKLAAFDADDAAFNDTTRVILWIQVAF